MQAGHPALRSQPSGATRRTQDRRPAIGRTVRAPPIAPATHRTASAARGRAGSIRGCATAVAPGTRCAGWHTRRSDPPCAAAASDRPRGWPPRLRLQQADPIAAHEAVRPARRPAHTRRRRVGCSGSCRYCCRAAEPPNVRGTADRPAHDGLGPQNRDPGCARNARSASVDTRPRIALRCGKRPNRRITSWCRTAHSYAPPATGSSRNAPNRRRDSS